MSLLEDIFLEDEANEAQELERIIEGDEYDDRPRSEGDDEDNHTETREDEAEEDKRRVDPSSTKTKRVIKNPRFILNPARLTGPRGIQVIPDHFKDFKFKGKGHEKEDLDMVLKNLEHWAYRLYPKFQFPDCLKKIETLGKKRPVMVHLHKIRTDQFLSEETVVQKDSSDDEAAPAQEEDEFDKLLQQQIDLARATPAPGSVKKVMEKSDQWARVVETPNRDDRLLIPMPKATSSPSISDEQKERMLRNRKLAEERRLARLKAVTSMDHNTPNTIFEADENEPVITKTTVSTNIVDDNKVATKKSNNRFNVIESSDSDDEGNEITLNESIAVDVHVINNIAKDKVSGNDKLLDKENSISEVNEIENKTAQMNDGNMDNDRKLDYVSEISNKDNDMKVGLDNNESNDSDIETNGNNTRNSNVNGNNSSNVSDRSEIKEASRVDADKIVVHGEITKTVIDQTNAANSECNIQTENELSENIASDKSINENVTNDVMDVDFNDDF